MDSPALIDNPHCWPPLPYASWQPTCETLHMWTQIVGKVRLALTPLVNHYWNVPLYVSARGLTTSAIPWRGSTFELEFDLVDHRLQLRMANGEEHALVLSAISVAEFYSRFTNMLRHAGIEVKIWRMPVEVPDPIPFDQDFTHASYDRDAVARFWQILVSASTVLHEFRARFLGKCSPVHFFWGSFDLAVTRFSGRRAPQRSGADAITREAYSHEVSSVGFWPGAGLGDPAFYSYAAPEPEGFAKVRIAPPAAHYDPNLKEFILLYDDVRKASSPSAALLDFCESTYDSAATLGHWDRSMLERSEMV